MFRFQRVGRASCCWATPSPRHERWADTYVGQIAAKFPQYDFLNGGVESYAPSNYLNVTRQLLDRGVKFDEVIVFIDISDAQDEAAFYQDKIPAARWTVLPRSFITAAVHQSCARSSRNIC